MKKIVLLLILVAAVLFAAGCTEETPGDSADSEEDLVVEVSDLEQINEALQKGPVFLKLGAEWCGPCREMEPILAEMAEEYEGRATIMSVDIDESPHLAAYFNVGYIPDSCVIAGLEDGNYLYVQQDGSLTEDRMQARMIGLRDKETFEAHLELALPKTEESETEGQNQTING
ncbi:thioredoxin family protein [Methanosarcina sp. Mfa9]|uniref:thioredoxin family protein n=1 Tax=Methanosarcina sp. Mfa9 TaxID=3439063 RepID=UPI003F871626